MTSPCLGGFCPLRNKCQHYVCPTNRLEPVERKCEKGAELAMFFRPLLRETTQ